VISVPETPPRCGKALRRAGPARGRRLARGALLAAVSAALFAAGAGTAGAAPGTATQSVAYLGHVFTVPVSWSVVDLDRQPGACVRFDRHAIYLGTPSADQQCPAQVSGRTEALLVGPAAGSAPFTDDSVSHEIAAGGAGVRIQATYATDRATVQRILTGAAILSGDSTAQSPAIAAAPAIVAASTTNYLGKGFDACAAPSASTMNTWRASSPYAAVGIYIGGADRGCAQPNLTAGWVSQQAGAGWHFLPLYVGPQASAGQLTAPTSQGTANAGDAANQAVSLGFGAGSVLYYDMEAYAASQRPAVLSFLSAWTDQLHAKGYRSGVYSSDSSGIRDLVGAIGSYTMPDVIDDAEWNGVPNTTLSAVPGGDWANHQRVHQYSGGHNETYGGVTINIDQDYLDVGVAVSTVDSPVSTVAQSGSQTVDAFGRGTGGDLVHWYYTPATGWRGPESLGGSLASPPAAVITSAGTVDVFYRGTDGNLWHRWYAPNAWYGPQNLGMGPLGGAPRAVGQPDGSVDVFWTGTNAALWHASYTPAGGWVGPQSLGGSLASDPSAVITSAGTVDVFYAGTDGNLWHRWYAPNAWYGPQSLGMGPLGGAPRAVGQPDGSVDVFWRGTNMALWHASYTATGGWVGPQSLGGSLAGDPAPTVTQSGTVDVFFPGSDSNLWHAWYANGAWNGPQSLGMGPLGSAPAAAGQLDGTVDVVWTGTNAALWHAWFTTGSGWNGPQSLGGAIARTTRSTSS
jgi:hypothetical protein